MTIWYGVKNLVTREYKRIEDPDKNTLNLWLTSKDFDVIQLTNRVVKQFRKEEAQMSTFMDELEKFKRLAAFAQKVFDLVNEFDVGKPKKARRKRRTKEEMAAAKAAETSAPVKPKRNHSKKVKAQAVETEQAA